MGGPDGLRFPEYRFLPDVVDGHRHETRITDVEDPVIPDLRLRRQLGLHGIDEGRARREPLAVREREDRREEPACEHP